MKMTWEFKSELNCTEKMQPHIFIFLYCMWISGNSPTLVYMFKEIRSHILIATLTAATNWQDAAGPHCQYKLPLGRQRTMAWRLRNGCKYCSISMLWMGWVSAPEISKTYPFLIPAVFVWSPCPTPPSYDMIWAAASQQCLLCCGRFVFFLVLVGKIMGCKALTKHEKKSLRNSRP